MLKKPLYIVLDTTAFVQDPNLVGPEVRLLEEFAKGHNRTIIVSEVVFAEAVNQFKEHLEKHLDEMDKTKNTLSWLTNKPHDKSKEFDVRMETQKYQSRLHSRLSSIGTVFLPYPNVNHEDLVIRDLARKRPFRDGRGYRDTLIWHSILKQVAENPGEYILVTKNSRDFCLDTDIQQLHDDLSSDLKLLPFSGKFIVRSELKEVVNEFIKPVLHRVEDIKHALQKGTYKSLSLENILEQEFQTIFEILNCKIDLSVLSSTFEEPFGIYTLGQPTQIRIKDVIELSDGDVYVEFTALYEADAYAYVSHFEAQSAGHMGFHISDPDWNETYSEVEGTVHVEVTIGLTYDFDEETATSVEVIDCDTLRPGGSETD